MQDPTVLQAIGRVAVYAARFEQQLHVAYWRYAGLSMKAGPIITERMNPKRVFEDIIKFAGIEFEADDKYRAASTIIPTPERLADLKAISSIYGGLSEQRNEVVHWIWKTSDEDGEHSIRAPGYMRGKVGTVKPYNAKQIDNIADGFKSLSRRMMAHYTSDQQLVWLREQYGEEAAVSFPAPWLDKPSQPDPRLHKTDLTQE